MTPIPPGAPQEPPPEKARLLLFLVAFAVAFLTTVVVAARLTSGEPAVPEAAPIPTTSPSDQPSGRDTTTAPTATTTTTTSITTTTTSATTSTTTTTTTTLAPSTTAAPPTTQPPSAGSNQVPATIDATCSSNVVSELNAWISSLPDGTSGKPTVAELGSGCYRLDGQLTVSGRNWLTIKGDGAVISGKNHLGRTGERHILIEGGSHLVVTGLEIVGAHTGAGAPSFPAWGCPNSNGDCHGHHGIAVQGSLDVVIEGNHIHNVYGDLVYVGWGPGGPSLGTRQVVIRGNTLEKSGRQGVSVTAGQDVVISNNVIAEARANLIDLEPGHEDAVMNDIDIIGNYFGARRATAVVLIGPGACGSFHDVTITGNTVSASPYSSWPSVYATSPKTCGIPRSGLVVTGNTLDTNAKGEGVVVEGNWVEVNVSKNTLVS